MVFDEVLSGWLALVGGVSGLLLLLYMVLMVYYSRQRERAIVELRLELAEIRGLLLGRRMKK